jgi:hypothetical protein
LLGPVISCLEQVSNRDSAVSSSEAQGMIKALRKPTFLVSLAVAETLFNVTVGLSRKLQGDDINLASAMRSVDDITSHLKAMGESDADFTEIMVRAEELAGKFKTLVPLEEPRKAGRQKLRDNVAGDEDVVTYFRRVVFLPFVDYIIGELDNRFKSRPAAFGLQLLLPGHAESIHIALPKIMEAAEPYAKDIGVSQQDIKGDVRTWLGYIGRNLEECSGLKFEEVVALATQLLLPSISTLLRLFATLSTVSTASAERSFSTLRRLKTSTFHYGRGPTFYLILPSSIYIDWFTSPRTKSWIGSATAETGVWLFRDN